MTQSIFITGTGTDVGKTLAAAIVAEALQADYWKPVQAGYEPGTDTDWVAGMLTGGKRRVRPETYRLRLAASPHIAAREEPVQIDLELIRQDHERIRGEIKGPSYLVIEGAGGLLVPLNEREFVIDLIQKLQAKVLLVSRNYLGSINHSLLTARACRQSGIEVLGWIFNDHYMDYEAEIQEWTGLPKIAAIPFHKGPDRAFVVEQALLMRPLLLRLLSGDT